MTDEMNGRSKFLGAAVVALLLAPGAFAATKVSRAVALKASEPMFLGQPAWSPNGRHIAWVAGPPNGYGTVWVADASGRNARPLHQFGQSLLDVDTVGQITWETPRSLLVNAQLQRDGNIHLFRLSLSGRLRQLAPLSDGTFSTDRARKLVATNGRPRCRDGNCPTPIDVLRVPTGNVTHPGSRGALNVNPALSPNGKRVAYNRAVCYSSGKCSHPRGIWLAAVSGIGNPYQLPGTGGYFPEGARPAWSPNGRLLAYVQSANNRIAVLALGGKPRTLPRLGVNPAFSPDSRLLAYDGVTNGGSSSNTIGHLVVLNLRAHRAVLVSPRRLGDINDQAWSPDGKKILAVARPRSANPDCPSLYMLTVRTRHWKLFRACGQAS